jgi:hypothetical protein
VGRRKTLRSFLSEALQELWSWDGRGLRTLRILISSPGRLTLEDWSGKRARSLPPMRLYLLASFVLFLVVSLGPSGGGAFGGALLSISWDDVNAVPEIDWDAQLAKASPINSWIIRHVARPLIENPEATIGVALDRLPVLFFLLVPIFALNLRWLYWNRDVYYLEHLVFSLHAQTFLFLAITIENLLRAALPSSATTATLLGFTTQIASATYLFVALRRVYRGRWPATALRWLLLILLQALAMVVGLLYMLAVLGSRVG